MTDSATPKRKPRKRTKRGGALTTLADLVVDVYPGHDPEIRDLVTVGAWWARSAPARLRHRVRPSYLKDGVLKLSARTPAWAHECQLLAPVLLESIQAALPNVAVSTVRTAIDRYESWPLQDLPISASARGASKSLTGRPGAAALPCDLTQLPDAVARNLAAVVDDRLRTCLGRAASTTLSNRDGA